MVTVSIHASHCVTEPIYATVTDIWCANFRVILCVTDSVTKKQHLINSLSKFLIPWVFQNYQIPWDFHVFQSCKHPVFRYLPFLSQFAATIRLIWYDTMILYAEKNLTGSQWNKEFKLCPVMDVDGMWIGTDFIHHMIAQSFKFYEYQTTSWSSNGSPPVGR